MNTTITDRDKKLLFILLLILVFFLGYQFVITPSIDKYKETNKKNDSLVQQQENMKTQIANIDTYKSQLSTVKQNYKETSSKVFGDIREPGVDQAITKLIADSGLSPSSFNIMEINNVTIKPYNIEIKDGAGGVVADTKSLVKVANIDIQATGTEANVLNAITSFDSTPGIHIQKMDVILGNESSSFKAIVSLVLSEKVE